MSENQVAADIIMHTSQRIHRIVGDALQIIPGGHEEIMLMVLAAQHLASTAAYLRDEDRPLYSQLARPAQLSLVFALLLRLLSDDDGAAPRLDVQSMSDILAAKRELSDLLDKVDRTAIAED